MALFAVSRSGNPQRAILLVSAEDAEAAIRIIEDHEDCGALEALGYTPSDDGYEAVRAALQLGVQAACALDGTGRASAEALPGVTFLVAPDFIPAAVGVPLPGALRPSSGGGLRRPDRA